MRKEKLTIENVKIDLLKKTKDTSYAVIGLTAFLLLLLIIIFCVPIIYKVLFGCLCAMVFYVVVEQIVQLINLHSKCRNADCIVKDKLIGMEIQEHVNSRSYYKTFHLYFSNYGEFLIPKESYKWSSMFRMSCDGVYNYSVCGDEFYLVLSKPQTGKILLAYNTKMFEFEE